MTKPREIPIYEKLDPNQCLIMFKTGAGYLIATNKKGDIVLKWVKYPK